MFKIKKMIWWVTTILICLLLRVFVFEIYLVPSGSMKGTLLPGDLVFASKIHFGTRFNVEKGIWRSPGFSDPERDEVVIFNFPGGYKFTLKGRSDIPLSKTEASVHKKYNSKETLEKANYVKRIVAQPGDTLQMINGEVIINGIPEYKQARMIKKSELRSDSLILKGKIHRYFPHSDHYNWNLWNIGPLIVPKKGETVSLDTINSKLHERIIREYENHQFFIRDGMIWIDGIQRSTYTFMQDYYYVLGDNRGKSSDSRFWGFLPKDHIKSRAVFVLFSTDFNNFDVWYSRFFRIIH